jgi:hypothetical protein
LGKRRGDEVKSKERRCAAYMGSDKERRPLAVDLARLIIARPVPDLPSHVSIVLRLKQRLADLELPERALPIWHAAQYAEPGGRSVNLDVHTQNLSHVGWRAHIR